MDIIYNIEGMNLLNIFMEYEEVIVLDAIGMDEVPGSMYQFPMSTFRGFSTEVDMDEMGVLGCLNVIEGKGNTLPKVSLLAIIPETIEPKVGLSLGIFKPFEAYILMIAKTLEDKEFSCEEKAEKQTLARVIDSFRD